MPRRRPTPLDVDYHRHAAATFLRLSIAWLLLLRVPGSHTHHDTKCRSKMITRLASTASPGAVLRRFRNINRMSIDYACRPRLRSRLTQGGLAWPWNPWSSGGRVSHPSFATHACILTRAASTTGSLRRFTRCTTLPYPTPKNGHCHNFGGVLEPRYIVGAESLDQ